ncbi:MAG: replicative DNA helicase [Candidatus Latescibacteria bacterium]|nr:replicative DNA helicase [Candidatus Latescibacterota bacterium]NIM22574.1 replicative DNA helicase [Candidatus Latescibacterota bacterium]NIM64863.1 replicative DNA helicase [Candidatus Latescibacterota bacterium]NIO01378.1 replicative DNA helicase [Candidatus Latescibacterota bacterium]NIO27888.1 replicative DNA helicase [Candidatus Latescibacterota bacterium]
MADVPQSDFTDKLPPQSLEAEKAVIGAILLDNASLSIAMEYLSGDTFYKRAHQDIFQAMENLFQKGEAIDIITLSEELKRMGRYQAMGGASYLSSILEDVHTSANMEYYTRLVLDKYILRRLISISGEVATECYADERETEEILDEAEKRIFEVSERGVRKGFTPVGKIIKQKFENIEKLYESRRHVSGLSSSYDELDSYTSGFQNADLVIVAGRPSMGKTSFALNVAQHLAIREKVPVGVFSLEMASEQLVMRLLCSEARVDSHRLRTGYLKSNEYAELAIVAGYLSEAPIYIDDSAGISTMEIRAKARRLKAEVNVGLIIIDYLQLISVRERAENRQQQISIISRGLKALAKELNIPVVALSQLSRAVEARGGDRRPMLSDLRESGAIEQDADVVLFLYRPEVYEGEDSDSKGIAELIIGKQRNGPTGTIKLAFIKEFTRFERLAPVSE